MTWQITVNTAGGLALFLLAMSMMTSGLQAFAGSGLRQLLGRWTRTPLRGVMAGVLVTGLVQSSSAVTVATIGFVNAGVLSLQQALGVIFGTNVGTTITGWLVSLVGFGFRIDAFALPILAAGVLLRLAAPRRRYQGLGEALAGFGLFFLGLSFLRDGFGGMADSFGANVLAAGDGPGLLVLVLTGVVATVLTQSSSAAIAIILTAAAGGVISIELAAGAVIGANLGTTSTAAVAVINATPAAKRLALGHIVFNMATGIIALALLPLLLWGVERLAHWFDVEGSPAAILALFHTVFNVLGVLIMLPFARQLAARLERLFRSAEEDLARPRHLDATLANTPALALAALREELLRLRSIVAGVVGDALAGAAPPLRHSVAVGTLVDAIGAFVTSLRGQSMSQQLATELAGMLRVTRYFYEASRLADIAARLHDHVERLGDESIRNQFGQFLDVAAGGFAVTADGDAAITTRRAEALDRLQANYREAKTALLVAVVGGIVAAADADSLLDELGATRRAVRQLLKGDRWLHSPQAEADPGIDEE